MKYEAVMGLEVHVQLNTATKAFCSCKNEFGARQNTNICPVCLGLPGSLPVLNAMALKSAVKAALALNCRIRNYIKFDRKNYFYPDLPKNFQISQYDMPLSEDGHLDIKMKDEIKRIRIKRIHLEEDAGKLMHPEGSSESCVDFNRAGTPLLEIVSEPDINSPDEAYEYLTDLKLILKYIGISDCDMEKGSLRCDANISLRPLGETKLGIKSELKNMNSFKAVKSALEYEIRRQAEVLDSSGKLIQETRLWNEKEEKTYSMRSKEEAHDYRYFPEPDLCPFIFSEAEIEEIKKDLPELPKSRMKRFMDSFQFSEKEAFVIISDKEMADFFEECIKLSDSPKKIANWMTGPLFYEMNKRNMGLAGIGISPESLVGLIKRVDDGTVSNIMAKDVLAMMIDTGSSADDIIKDKGLAQMSSADDLAVIVEDVIAKNKKSVDDYLGGKENALMFLVGQVMRFSKGKANPKVAKDLLIERLKK